MRSTGTSYIWSYYIIMLSVIAGRKEHIYIMSLGQWLKCGNAIAFNKPEITYGSMRRRARSVGALH